jgi:NAD-dependent deacetylase
MSAESGIPTFRDAGGLWEGHRVEAVASPEAWARDPGRVLRFYNLRREAAWQAQPHLGHHILARLEAAFRVVILTQNVDALHERAGSSQVLHLHGELSKVRSTLNPRYIQEVGGAAIQLGDTCPQGAQLRPHIVWFGEDVPLYPQAAKLASQADLFLVVGTSLQVYPAAGLIDYVPAHSPIWLIDQKVPAVSRKGLRVLETSASEGLSLLAKQLAPELYVG